MNLTLHLILCAVLIVITAGVYIYRRKLENQCDHYIHLHGDTHDASIISAQSAMCKRLETVDKVKTGLLVAVILYVLAIAGMAIYSAWNNPGTT